MRTPSWRNAWSPDRGNGVTKPDGQRPTSSTPAADTSDTARVVGGTSWRELMDMARDVAEGLARDEIVVVRQHGMDIDLAMVVGPVRLARGRQWVAALATG